MTGAPAMRRTHLVARFDARSVATLDDLVPLEYARGVDDALPAHVRAASGLRQFRNRLVIVQDDVNAFAVRDLLGEIRPVLLPPGASGERVFDDTRGNKHDKLDLEACVTLSDGRLVAFGSGSTPAREQLVVWDGRAPPSIIDASAFYRDLRTAVVRDAARLNVEGAVVRGARLELFHRGNDERGAAREPLNAIAELSCDEFASWLGNSGAPSPRIRRVTTVELGDVRGVPYGFTDAVALDSERVVILACAEDSTCAISDGAVLGCRIGLLDAHGLRTVDVCDAAGRRTLLKLEGIERRAGSSVAFDVAVDVDLPAAPAQLGCVLWEWH
jgi:hypothetical protein